MLCCCWVEDRPSAFYRFKYKRRRKERSCPLFQFSVVNSKGYSSITFLLVVVFYTISTWYMMHRTTCTIRLRPRIVRYSLGRCIRIRIFMKAQKSHTIYRFCDRYFASAVALRYHGGCCDRNNWSESHIIYFRWRVLEE